MSLCPGMENLTITLPEEHVKRLERLTVVLSSRPPRTTVLRAEVMRACILRGIEEIEAEVTRAAPGETKPK